MCYIWGCVEGKEVGEEREEDRNNNSLSYHCTVINSLLVREPVPRLGSGLMTNHLHTALQPQLFMTKTLLWAAARGASWAPNSSWAGVITPGTQWQPQMGHSVTSYHAPPLYPHIWQHLQHIILWLLVITLVVWSIPAHQLSACDSNQHRGEEKNSVLTTYLSCVVFLFFLCLFWKKCDFMIFYNLKNLNPNLMVAVRAVVLLPDDCKSKWMSPNHTN